MVLLFGQKTVLRDWHVNDVMPPNFVRIYYVYGGNVIYEDESIKTQLKKGFLYLFPSSVAYRMTQDPQNPLELLYLHLDIVPNSIDTLKEIQPDKFLSFFLEALHEAVIKNDKDMVFAMADALQLYLDNGGYITHPNAKLSKTLLYIAEHIADNMSVCQLSRMSGYNEQYFIRLFRSSVGVSPYQYIINCRMKEATRLLRESYTVTEVADMIGYPDIKTFGRAFKAKFGLPPSIWKKSYIPVP